jgi:hypothetical protein
MAVGTSFTMMALGKASADMNPEDRGAFMLRAFAVAKVASGGFGLLIATGFAMLMMQAQVLMEVGGKRFMLKLGLVGLQVVFFAVMQITLKRVKEAKGGPLMAKVPKIGKLLMLNGLAIVLTAVLAFH